MKPISSLILVAVFLLGCDQGGDPITAVDRHISSWNEAGARLPDAAQVKAFRDNFVGSSGSLRKALSHPEDAVRMRAAFVIGELGPKARTMGEDLLTQFVVESSELVRIYIVEALSSVGYDREKTVATLSKHYRALDGANVPPDDEHDYAEVDEKIAIAATLYSVLPDADSKREYYEFVTQWLSTPSKELAPDLLAGYWERRWMAVSVLERMPEATDAISKLDAMLVEADSQPWVSVHVPRVLQVLRSNSR